MSYSDQPGYGSPKMIGCAVLGLIGTFFVGLSLFVAALGHCAPEADGSGCQNDGLIKFLMFPGSLILPLIVGIFAARRVMKDKD